MIPYSGQTGNDKAGMQGFFVVIAVIAIVLGLGAGFFDSDWMVGPFIMAGAFLTLAWLMKFMN